MIYIPEGYWFRPIKTVKDSFAFILIFKDLQKCLFKKILGLKFDLYFIDFDTDENFLFLMSIDAVQPLSSEVLFLMFYCRKCYDL